MNDHSVPYDYRGCTSLFGYSAAVHQRSGASCELCEAGKGQAPNFDFWRQLTVEHLIGRSQGGYADQIRAAVLAEFPNFSDPEREDMVRALDEMNTISACTFCNSTTSRDTAAQSMTDLIMAAGGDPQLAITVVRNACAEILARKRADVAWKLESVRDAFEREVLPGVSIT